jgi:hypothetical protein
MSDDFELVRSPRLSIVIPAPADTAALEETLVSVLENRPHDCEIVVALGCEYADPWNIREEVRFVQAPVGSGLVSCVNLGVAASEGTIVHVLAAGWRATAGWTDAAMARFDDDAVAAVVPVGVAADDRDRVVSAGVRTTVGGRRIDLAFAGKWRRERLSAGRPVAVPMGPVLEAGFWRADAFEMAGPGFSTACGEAMADADMAVTLARSGRTVAIEPEAVVVAAPRSAGRSRPFAAGLHAERLFWRSLAGQAVVPAAVGHLYEVVRHAIARAPLGTVPMLVGRLVALLQFGAYLPRYLQLRDIIASAAADRSRADEEAAGRTIRIDGPHAAAAGPKRRQTQTPLRKSA